MILLFILTFVYLFVSLSTHVSLLFWLLLFTNIIVSCIMTILAINPVNSIFFLITLFLNVGIVFFTLNLVYLALIIIIVYVGALAVFFLFTLMLLNINIIFVLRANPKSKIIYIFEFFLFFVFFVNFFIFLAFIFSDALLFNSDINDNGNLFDMNSLIFSTTDLYAHSLYTVYGSIFVFLGFFLFIVMVGVILLLQQFTFLKRNSRNVDKVFFRNFKNTLFSVKNKK